MSIMSEIQRIDNNIQETLNICANAGVDVAEDANSDALPAAVSELAAMAESGNDSGSTVAAPYVFRLTDSNMVGNLYEEWGEVYDTLSDDDKNFIYYGCGTGIGAYFTVVETGECRCDIFECNDNYDELLKALRDGRSAYIKKEYSVDEIGYPHSPINAAVTGFYLTRLGLVVMTPWHWVWLPNGSSHNENTDPWVDTWG